MATTALRPLAVDFTDLLAGSDCEIEEFRLSEDPLLMSHIAHRSLQELDLARRTGAMVLAIRDNNFISANPNGEFTLAPGQMLVVMGSKQQLEDLRQIFGDAIDDCELLSFSWC